LGADFLPGRAAVDELGVLSAGACEVAFPFPSLVFFAGAVAAALLAFVALRFFVAGFSSAGDFFVLVAISTSFCIRIGVQVVGDCMTLIRSCQSIRQTNAG